jgi:hypothetical protein
MSWKIVAAALLVTTSLTTGSPPVAPNDPPEVDAGLDQRVYAGTTVLLDAGGTRDPDGTITSYAWRIETPSGTNITPDCATCERTRFEPTDPGTYAVTLTATDDDGASRSDTLYVTVRTDDGPSITLDGPRTTPAGTTVNFQATPNPGTEPLAAVNWTMDGTQLQTANSTTLTRTVTDPGTRTITVSVTDAIGRTASTTTTLTVEPNTGDTPPPTDPPTPIFNPGNGSSEDDPDPTPPPGNDTTRTTLADRYDPTIAGPQTVTGDEPLTVTYEIQTDALGRNITSIEWIANGNAVASASTLRSTWTPGDHTLSARITYTDGSTDEATFADDTTIVEADPAPEPRLGTPTLETSQASGPFEVVDDYNNLKHVTITVNDDIAFDATYPPDRYRAPTRITDTYQITQLEPDTEYTVTLTATDARGQTRTKTKTIRTDSQTNTTPEILTAGFTRDTTDSYHPRIDPERYTVEHVIKINLNGYPASKIEFNTTDRSQPLKRLSQKSRNYNQRTDTLIIKSAWAGDSPGRYRLEGDISLNTSTKRSIQSQFMVTPSPPELRITSPTQGTKKRVEDWGMVVDASRSFDPDGTKLSIQWLQGAEPIHKKSFKAKLNPYKLAGVRIEDMSGSTAKEMGSFLSYYIPRVQEPDEVTEGPYNESDFVTLELRTEPYAFTKGEDRYNITLGARSNSSAVEVVSVSKKDVEPNPASNQNEVKHRQHMWVVRVKVRASSLNDSENWVTVYNAEKPRDVFVTKELGDANIRFSSEKRDLEVQDTVYEVVNRNGTERREVIQAMRAHRLLTSGWRVESTRQVVDSVVIESLTQETVTEERTKRFDSDVDARNFIRNHEGWTSAGVESYEETEIEVVTKWVLKRSVGIPTGQTRRVVTNPDAVVELRQYRYVQTKTVEEQRTVIEEKIKTVTKTRTRERTVCSPVEGCREIEEQVPYETTVVVEEPVEKTVSVEKRETKRYWARSPRMPSHRSTGAVRSVRTEPREYATEYRVKMPEERTVTKRDHLVSREVTVTRETWQPDSEVNSMRRARAIVSNPNKRIGSINDHKEWVLAKDKTVTEVKRSYDEKGNVETTSATVTGVLEYAPDETRPFEIQVKISGYATKEEILETAMRRKMTCEDDTEDCHA